MSQPVINVTGLDVHYGDRQVLFDVTAHVNDGEIAVIMGGSGSGKSTFLRHLVALEPAPPGAISLLGEDFASLRANRRRALRRRMGVAFQGGALFSSMTVAENIKLPLREHTRLDERTMDIMANLKLEVVNLAGFGDFMPASLSGGMIKRAAVARAIVMDPQLLFFDEPSAGLDPVVSSALDDLILQLRDAMGVTVVVVTHEIASALAIADRIIVLDRGRVIAMGTPEEIQSHPSERVQNLLNRRPEDPDIDPAEYLARLTGTPGHAPGGQPHA